MSAEEKNTTKINSIAKNTSFFTAALIVQKAITLLYFTVLARNLVPEDLGRYYLAISFSSIFITIIDLGQANVLTREIAKKKEGAQKMINIIMAIKLPLILFSSVLVFVLANLMQYPDITRHLIYMAILLMLMDSLSTTFFAVIRGFHNLVFESISSILTQLIIMVIGIIFVYAGMGLKMLMLAMILGTAFRFLFSLILLIFKWKINIKPVFDMLSIKSFLLLTVPFAVFAIYQKLYTYLDTVMLSKLATDYHVGLYQIAFKIIFALQFLPMAFIASLYPAFASYWKEMKSPSVTVATSPPKGANLKKSPPFGGSTLSLSKGEGGNVPQLLITFERGFNYLLIVSMPIAIGIAVIADKIILLFKPEYMAAVPSLRIIIFCLPFLFLNFPIGALLNACDKQKTNTRIMGYALIFSIILNLILIPKFNVVGAGITVVVTNIFMFILGMFAISDIINIRPRKIFLPMFKVMLVSLLMGVVTYYTKVHTHIILSILISAAFYFFGVYFMGVVKKEDVRSVVGSFGNDRAN